MSSQDMLERFIPLVGEEAINTLKKANVCVVGIGGVGGQTCLALARCGISNITLIDPDVVNISNINRQAVAFHSTIDKFKTHVMRDFIIDINPSSNVKCIQKRIKVDDIDKFISDDYDIVIDAIDDVQAKIALIDYCYDNSIKCVSSMGAGNRLDPTKFVIADISKTYNDPLARKVRQESKKRRVKKHKVVFSEETPKSFDGFIGSAVFVTATAGLLLAKAAIDEIIVKEVSNGK